MTTNPLTAAIAHIRRITPSNDAWFARDIAYDPDDPDEIDDSIATILNAVVSGRLILAPSAVGAAAPDLIELTATLTDALEVERKRAEKAETERDEWKDEYQTAARLRNLYRDAAFNRQIERDKALARLAAVQAEMIEWCANIADDNTPAKHGSVPLVAHVTGKTIANTIRCIPRDSDAQAALNKMLSDVRAECWLAGREAAAAEADKYAASCLQQAGDSRSKEQFETAKYVAQLIRSL